MSRGIPKHRTPERRRYLVWEEGKGPDVVIEFTSASTEEEDRETKMRIYRDVLRMKEYFLFDPYAEYLEPRSCAGLSPPRGRLSAHPCGQRPFTEQGAGLASGSRRRDAAFVRPRQETLATH